LLVLLLVVIAALLVAGAAIGAFIDRGYRRELGAWAAARGWSYREDGGGDWAAFLPQGYRRRVKIEMAGPWQGRPMTVAHYWYQVRHSSRNAPRTYHLTVVVVRLAVPHPTVVLYPRALGSVGHGIAKAVGLPSANATGVREFDNRYRIDAGLGARAELVTEQAIRVTLEADLPPWQLRDRDLIIAWRGSPNMPSLDQKLAQAFALAAQLDGVAGRGGLG
jgi:hypothetical protein